MTGSRFPRVQAAGLGSLPQGTTEELRFVQDRVALLGKVTFFISGMFLIAVAVADHLRHFNRVQLTGRVSHALGTLIALGMWQVLRHSRAFSPSALLVFDLLGTFCICASFIGMGHFAVQPYGYYTAMLAVTHLPQVAASADQQWQVAKNAANGQVLSRVTVLGREERVEEIARMLGGVKITETTRKHAAEMLKGGDR